MSDEREPLYIRVTIPPADVDFLRDLSDEDREAAIMERIRPFARRAAHLIVSPHD